MGTTQTDKPTESSCPIYLPDLKCDVSSGWRRVVSDRAMNHDVGNLLNAIVFGRTYDKEDETWIELQRSREEGIKKLNVDSGLNFFPMLSWMLAK
jgi:hypothetical protein